MMLFCFGDLCIGVCLVIVFLIVVLFIVLFGGIVYVRFLVIVGEWRGYELIIVVKLCLF